ncbi:MULTISPECIES: hypothetical protein [Leuconostoc]|uniref:Uncharacterized protein n=2 Tax=Leuconostoc kimchii TaxID=136609 RepID=D5T350_LEUKI|nr:MULTISPECIES: hypothetical protein [Leuconostoc]ADG40699.1 hypothetical protein LKI_05790 [Leuconostoc kimchii IMSNU 11154]AEJ31324.1 hypothetical protein LGMK_06350 [Leuconostoc sp. C2]QBR47152.1 hypothetical protein EW139_03060 [Leuconostoc kimchii]
MQNYLTHHPMDSYMHYVVTFLNRFTVPKRHVPLKQQLSADDLIARLEIALNTNSPVTIQLNNSLLSEDVTNISGYVYQNNNGEILVQSPKTHSMTVVLPGMIRHL